MKQEAQIKKMFVGGVPSRLTHSEIFEFFKKMIPELETVELPLMQPRNPTSNDSVSKSQRNKGFAVVHIKSSKRYTNLLKKKFLYLKKRKVTLREYLKGDRLHNKRKVEIQKRIFIPRLPHRINLQRVRSRLEQRHGKIDDIFRLVNPITGKQKACAYCFFNKAEDANKALQDQECEVGSFKLTFLAFDEGMGNKFKHSIERKETMEKQQEDKNGKMSSRENLFLHETKPTQRKYWTTERDLPKLDFLMLRFNHQ